MFALSGRLRVVAGVVAVLLLPYARPAFAQAGERVNPDHDFAKFMIEVLDFAGQAQAIHIFSQYCKPPYSPQKSEAQWEIHFLELMMKRARADHQRFRNRAKASFGSRAGMSYIGGFPRVDGIDLSVETFDRYFGAALREIQRVEAILARKQEQLNAAPLRDCANIAEQRVTPPADPAPAPADPAARLTRPTPRDLPYPELPPYFCSREQKAEFLRSFQEDVLRPARLNGQDANNYDATVSERANDFDRAGQTAVADRLRRTEGKWAIDNAKAREKDITAAEAFRRKIIAIDIVDCDESGKRVASAVALPSTPVRVGLGADFATFPKFERYVRDQPGLVDGASDKHVNGLHAFAEVVRNQWVYGLQFRTGEHEFTQQFANLQTVGSARGYFIRPFVERRFGPNVAFIKLGIGPVVAVNRLAFKWLTGTDLQEDTRTHIGMLWGVGGSFNAEHPSGWGVSVGTNHVGFPASADNYQSVYGNITWRFGPQPGIRTQRVTGPRPGADR